MKFKEWMLNSKAIGKLPIWFLFQVLSRTCILRYQFGLDTSG